MASGMVKLLAEKINEKQSQPSVSRPGEGRPSRPFKCDSADQSKGCTSLVKQAAHEQDIKLRAAQTARREVGSMLQRAVVDVRAAGHTVTPRMEEMGLKEANLGREGIGMQEQIRRVLLREVAVQSALREAGQDFRKEGDARLAAARSRSHEYEDMFAAALLALSSEKMCYVVAVTGYKREGLRVVLSLASLGEEFDMTVDREALVENVVWEVQQDRLRRRPAGPGKVVAVKLVGPAGTVLPVDVPITQALDCEGEQVKPDCEDGKFYPLSVLVGEEWRKMGIPGQTRWQLLREEDFRKVFGMGKDAFELLPDWKQIPLKKKHGLF